jgi:oligopeptide transport system permease protein
MTEHALYNPQAGEFKRVTVSSDVQQLTRPSLSFWQDAWARLKKNKRAMASLCIVVALILFTLIGPLLWRVDPAVQDLDQISQFITFNKKAIVTASQTVWEGVTLDNFPAEPDEEPDELLATAKIEVVDSPTTQRIRLKWAPVEGAAGYVIYRNEKAPDPDDLGIPVGETDAGNIVGYEDRLKLEARTYHYSIVATDGLDEADTHATIGVKAVQGIILEEAQRRGLGGSVGETVTLKAHPLGTDYLGRDMLSRLMFGARISMFVGIIAPIIFVIFGTIYGGFAGFLGGVFDRYLMAFSDFVVALPFLLFMILFKISFGIGPGESGVVPMLIALVMLSWPGTSRLVRGQVMQQRGEGYIQAAQLLGAKSRYLIMRHMIPNTMGVILVSLTFAVPTCIFTEAFLSFIGMGVAPPTPSWGSMCNEGIKTMLSHPHELIFPAIMISITVLAFNLLGDGLRDALDPRMRSRE